LCDTLFLHVLPPQELRVESFLFGLDDFCPDAFQAREALLKSMTDWAQGQGSKIAVHGMGGTGKSSLAKHFMVRAGESAGVREDICIFLRFQQVRCHP